MDVSGKDPLLFRYQASKNVAVLPLPVCLGKLEARPANHSSCWLRSLSSPRERHSAPQPPSAPPSSSFFKLS
ncbi:hypothetical protein E2C01_084544 [Portunus trituberculatus]|uniref:Uncharacterized protein n=1 Tax=Portunus trituberculatus TaxID=210409 RepID=A0A5B7IYJ8_PORTR|nr:hypothetical protein [Portunus trituberculatus]